MLKNSTTSRLTRALVIMLLAGELAILFLSSVFGLLYEIYHLAQTAVLILLAFAIKKEIQASPSHRYLKKETWLTVAKLLCCGAGFSILGDFVNSGLVDFTFLLRPQALVSIPFFALAHLCYIASFYLLSPPPPKMGWQSMLARRRVILTSLALPFLAMGIWSTIVSQEATPLISRLSLAYAFVICAMTLFSLWVWFAWKKPGMSVALGALSFLSSDALLGYYLLWERPFLISQIIWITYILGQLLIVRAGLLYRSTPAPER